MFQIIELFLNKQSSVVILNLKVFCVAQILPLEKKKLSMNCIEHSQKNFFANYKVSYKNKSIFEIYNLNLLKLFFQIDCPYN